jgi:hypothetical protein
MSVRTSNTPKPKLHRMREPFATIYDRVCDRARAFFDDHPGERHYVRPFVPGEHDPETLKALGITSPAQDSWVLVHNIRPGFRLRQPIGQILAGGPINGRMTLVFPDGTVLAGVLVAGWEDRR